ncbi:MAG TPA: hypothetical protein PLD02_14755 [Saprospiraceae bacterium]|nr:hypothetical protein [Saprospiraceae bacterium]
MKLFYLFLFIPFLSFGQINDIPSEMIGIGDSLKKSGIDTFIVFKEYFSGPQSFTVTLNIDATEDEKKKAGHEAWCKTADPLYILYKQKGKVYVHKRNPCFTFKTLSFDSIFVFTYLTHYVNKLVQEKVFYNASINQSCDTIYNSRFHTSVTDIYFCVGSASKVLEIDWYNLSKAENNINYDYNSKTKTKRFINLVSNTLKTLTFVKN